MESSRSESAQQLSACAWVTLSEPLSCEFPLCIGQVPPSEQHAIRASGLDIHPAQTAAFPAIKARASARTERRFATVITRLGWSTAQPSVNRHSSAKSAKDERSENDLPLVVVAPGPAHEAGPEWNGRHLASNTGQPLVHLGTGDRFLGRLARQICETVMKHRGLREPRAPVRLRQRDMPVGVGGVSLG